MSPANRTYFPVYDLLELEMDDDDETTSTSSSSSSSSNDANKASFSTLSNVQNHNYNHPNHNHRKHNHQQPLYHSHAKKTNRWNVYPFSEFDSHRHQQRKSKHMTTETEWIKHFHRSNESKPKLRRRHEKRWNRNHRQFIGVTDQITSKLHADLEIQSARIHELAMNHSEKVPWPVKKEAIMEGDVILGGLMMVHSREDLLMCGPIMPQGGIQALEAMLYTLDRINEDLRLLPNITIGAHILDDCDRDSYGLEMAVDFIKGMFTITFHISFDRHNIHCEFVI